MIFEVVASASAPPLPLTTVNHTASTASKKKKSSNPDEDISESIGVGSICGGGRYDDLVGRFTGESRQIPCVGMSVGIERVFTLLKAKYADKLRASETQVYLIPMGNVSVESRFAIMKELWDAGINVLSVHFALANERPNSSIRLNRPITPNNSNWLKRARQRLLLSSEKKRLLLRPLRSNSLELICLEPKV